MYIHSTHRTPTLLIYQLHNSEMFVIYTNYFSNGLRGSLTIPKRQVTVQSTLFCCGFNVSVVTVFAPCTEWSFRWVRLIIWPVGLWNVSETWMQTIYDIFLLHLILQHLCMKHNQQQKTNKINRQQKISKKKIQQAEHITKVNPHTRI